MGIALSIIGFVISLVIFTGIICYRSGYKVGSSVGYNRGSWETILKNMNEEKEKEH